MTPPPPVFSVLLPTHSRSDVLPFAIASVLRQDEADFELLVVGDGAVAGTAEIVTGFTDTRVRWFDLPKAPGFGYANRNHVLRQARGRYVAFMTDDDLLFSDHLSLLRRHLDAGAVFACTRAAWVSTDGIAAPLAVSLRMADERKDFLERANILPSTCFAYRRDAAGDGPPLAEEAEHSADWLLWRRLAAANPPEAFAASPRFSVLHFAARRNASRYSLLPDLKALLEIADHSAWWPEVLRPSVPSGQPEQQAWARVMAQAQGEEAVRDALAAVVDRLAWERVQGGVRPQGRVVFHAFPPEPDPRVGQLEAELAEARRRHEADLLEARRQLDGVLAGARVFLRKLERFPFRLYFSRKEKYRQAREAIAAVERSIGRS